MSKPCDKCGEEIAFISKTKGKWEPFNVKNGTPHICPGRNPGTLVPTGSTLPEPDRQRLIVRQSCLKVACDAWCCSNHAKQEFDLTLAEIIRGMKILEEAVFQEEVKA